MKISDFYNILASKNNYSNAMSIVAIIIKVEKVHAALKILHIDYNCIYCFGKVTSLFYVFFLNFHLK